MSRVPSWTRIVLAASAALGLLAVAMAPAPQSGAASDPFPGMAGIDTSLPMTGSAVTIEGRGAFGDTDFTINQTEDLTNQAISITWEGAPPTIAEPRTFYSNFIQVMQCWGEPDDLVPENPGPPPENCVWGSLNPTAGSEVPGFATHLVTSRAFSNRDFPEYDPSIGTVDEQSGDVFRDFVAVDGTVITDHVDATATGQFEQYWLNPYFDSVKTNEVPGVRTLADGRGQALFTVNTGLESSGLGCGQLIEQSPGAEPAIPRCWLVIVPRGTPQVENVGIPFSPTVGVASSPMNPESWKNRIAVELEFTPVDSPCSLDSDQRGINGTELALRAVSSWQPALCTQPGRLPYAYGVVSDGLARQQLLSEAQGSPGMIAVNRALPDGTAQADDPVLYAPLTASAIGIGFHIERIGVLGGTDDRRLQGVRYSRINLTPRLVAKMLTQSYRGQVEILNSKPYEWDDDNPVAVLTDPDFLEFNPEFKLWGLGSAKHAGGLVLPAGSADLASQVWDWVLADPEAATWLAGEPDEWGMVVNPVYATTAEVNPSGLPFGSPPPDSFPKSDPYCYQANPLASGVVPPPICALDYFPYASGFGEAAQITAAANDTAKTALDLFSGNPNEAWKRSGPQTLGRRTMFAMTDLPSMATFGLQTARLSRAGDNSADREFVAPDVSGLSTALRSMGNDAGVLRLDQAEVGPGAYPLTTIVHAAVRPLSLDAAAREDYAAFLDHAAGPGQVPGFEFGQLPPGYLPLPPELAQTTATVADKVRTLTAPTPTTPPTVPVPEGPLPPPVPSPDTGFPSFAPSGGFAATPDPVVATPEATPPSVEPPTTEAEVLTPSGQLTLVTALGSGRFAFAGIAVVMLLSGLGFLEITKRPRRRTATTSAPTP
ncbi:MAG: hypothetical protein ACSLFP_06980 [Acidimicrobiales bacterium]